MFKISWHTRLFGLFVWIPKKMENICTLCCLSWEITKTKEMRKRYFVWCVRWERNVAAAAFPSLHWNSSPTDFFSMKTCNWKKKGKKGNEIDRCDQSAIAYWLCVTIFKNSGNQRFSSQQAYILSNPFHLYIPLDPEFSDFFIEMFLLKWMTNGLPEDTQNAINRFNSKVVWLLSNCELLLLLCLCCQAVSLLVLNEKNKIKSIQG